MKREKGSGSSGSPVYRQERPSVCDHESISIPENAVSVCGRRSGRGRIYEISDNFGVFVAVDDQYSGLIPKTEAQGQYRPGEGKLPCDKCKRGWKTEPFSEKKAYQQMDEDSELVLKVIGEYAGVLPFDDKVSPEVIKREFGLSKAAFKRAVGHLLKEKKIKIQDKRIYLIFRRQLLYYTVYFGNTLQTESREENGRT